LIALEPLPADFAATRDELHRVAAHILGRRRHAVARRFGLRAAPGGFGTPAFGEEVEVVRVAGGTLVRERGSAVALMPLPGATLSAIAAFVEVSLDPGFRVGHDTPSLGDVDAPLAVGAEAALALGAWYEFGWRVLDEALVSLPPAVDASARPKVVQLWPEHFDAGTDVAWDPERENGRVNLGASPGDGFHPAPYLYVGPWGPERPGDASYWNVPFGALLSHDDLRDTPDPAAAGLTFIRHGLAALGAGSRGSAQMDGLDRRA
jgi:hypothetical protein